MTDPLADAAYAAAQDAVEARREELVDAATDAHDRGDEPKAQRLLALARATRFTGLWTLGDC